MLSDTSGIHHVTGIVGDAGTSATFYAEVLGLRLLRRTVNYNDMLQYHLYFGDRTGSAGAVFTVFPDPHGDPGRVGRPGYQAVSFAIPPGTIDDWADRLARYDIAVERPDSERRFGDAVLQVTDPFGTPVELVEAQTDGDPWTDGSVPAEQAIQGIYGTTALSMNPYGTASILETLGFEYIGERADRIRYQAPGDHARIIELLDREAPYVREGPGTVHHTAVRVPDREALLEWHSLFRERDYDVSTVKDRHFFHSLYVRGPGNVLIELASEAPTPTTPPGPGLADPDVTGHATELYLPDRFADDRKLIEDQLPPFSVGQ